MVERPILLWWLDCHRIATAGLINPLDMEACREEMDEVRATGLNGDEHAHDSRARMTARLAPGLSQTRNV